MDRWRGGTRAMRVLRWVLGFLIVVGLCPGAAELLDVAEHLLHDGHLPHSAAHDVAAASEQHGETNDEHGCSPTSHHCKCCVNLLGLPPAPALPWDDAVCSAVNLSPIGSTDPRGPERATPPPVPPPIA